MYVYMLCVGEGSRKVCRKAHLRAVVILMQER